MEALNYYVYSHTRKDNGKCFYIGKGKGRRAYTSQHRNKHWNSIVNKCGYDVSILVNSISEDKALELERSFISQLGLDTLSNATPGGDYNPMTSAEHRATLSRVKSKPIEQWQNGIFIREWPSQKAAREATGITTIIDCLRGKQKHAGGFQWVRKTI